MKPQLYIRFSIRGAVGSRERMDITFPLRGAWQEGSNDLHVAFAYKGADPEDGCWYHPAVDKKTGDYLLPVPDWATDEYAIVCRKSPQTGATTKCVLAYCMEWVGFLPHIDNEELATQLYIKQVERFWHSPNI